MCFVFIWEETATCATYSINWLGFITEMKSVYCAVRTKSLNKTVCASSLKGCHLTTSLNERTSCEASCYVPRCLCERQELTECGNELSEYNIPTLTFNEASDVQFNIFFMRSFGFRQAWSIWMLQARYVTSEWQSIADLVFKQTTYSRDIAAALYAALLRLLPDFLPPGSWNFIISPEPSKFPTQLKIGLYRSVDPLW